MKTFAAVAVAACVSTACVVPVAGPAVYGEPSIYGQAEIGNYPPPLVYSQPIVVAPPPYGTRPAPIYLHVPPGHHQNWGHHCGRYKGCDRPAYFVREHHPRSGAPAGSRVDPAPLRGDDRRWQGRDERAGRPMPPYRPFSPSDPRVR